MTLSFSGIWFGVYGLVSTHRSLGVVLLLMLMLMFLIASTAFRWQRIGCVKATGTPACEPTARATSSLSVR